MDQHCTQCNQPRKPRHDRPGKFFTLCDEHYAEYQRQKNRESYRRHKNQRVKDARVRYWEDPEKAREIVRKSIAKPEAHERKMAYMEIYNNPARAHLKDRCEQCGWIAEHRRQLDAHHKDCNKANNDPSNVETLCPPCHRIVDLE